MPVCSYSRGEGETEADVRRIRALRVATALAIAGATLTASGSPALAARPAHAAMFTPRMLAAMAPRGGLLHRMATLLPGTEAPSLASLALFSDPANVTVNGVTYRMALSVQNLPAAFDQPPEVVVELDRTTSAGGRLTGEQAHVYGYAPIGGLDFHANAGLTRARVTTGASISPSAIDMRFHVSGTVEQVPCTLLGGGRGTFQAATGTLSAQTFRIATGTAPFFGTITTVPATATIVHYPGCSDFTAAARAAHPTRPVFHFPCAGRETIQHASLTSVWSGERGFGGGRVTELGLVESNPFGPDGVGHLAVGIGRGADMPAPVHTRGGGIRASVSAAGVPFMGGRAVFASTGKAHVSPGHTCVWERHVYRYTVTRYAGRLTAAGSPLQMLFDTGAEAVTPVRATLYLRAFSR
jgi:hypothetical protein